MDKPNEIPNTKLIAERLAKDLDLMYKNLQAAGGDSPDQEIVAILAVPLAKLTKMCIMGM